MSQFEHQWQKLAALARGVPDDGDVAAPYGFAARVAAQAADGGGYGAPWAALERLAVRGLLAAAACCVAAFAFNFLGYGGETSIETLEETVNGTALDLS